MEMANFSGGEGLKSYLDKLTGSLGGATQVEVGFLEGSQAGWAGPRPLRKGQKKTVKTESSVGHQMPAATVAFMLEYGTSKMPPRPFFSNMISRRSPYWGKLVEVALKSQGFNSDAALQMVGLKIKEQLQQEILEFTNPDILQSTKDRKGFIQPLIDSHNMIDSIDFRVA